MQSTIGAGASSYGLLCDTLWLELNIGGIDLGVPMIIMPWWSDQPTNARFVEELWQVGVKAKKNKGFRNNLELLNIFKIILDNG